MSAVSLVLDALRAEDVLSREALGQLLESECLPSAIDATLATMCRRGLIERLESGAYTLASEEAQEEAAAARVVVAPAEPAMVSTGGRPRPETPAIDPEPDDGRTLFVRILALLQRTGPLNSGQMADLLPGANRSSVFAAPGKLALRGLLRKCGHGRYELAPAGAAELTKLASAPKFEQSPPQAKPAPTSEPPGAIAQVVEAEPAPERAPMTLADLVERHAPQPEPEPEPELAPEPVPVQPIEVPRTGPYSARAELDGLTLWVEGDNAVLVASVFAAAMQARASER